MDNTSNGNNKLEFKTDRQTLVSPDINDLRIERKETKVVNNPLAPGHLGGPVIVTDESGNRIGNVWKASEDSELGQALKNVESGSATSVYFDLRTGKFSNYPASSMTYKDGKIILNVADDVANADWYKNNSFLIQIPITFDKKAGRWGIDLFKSEWVSLILYKISINVIFVHIFQLLLTSGQHRTLKNLVNRPILS